MGNRRHSLLQNLRAPCHIEEAKLEKLFPGKRQIQSSPSQGLWAMQISVLQWEENSPEGPRNEHHQEPEDISRPPRGAMVDWDTKFSTMSINSGSVGSGTVCNSENDHGRNQAMVNGAGMTRSAYRKTRAPLYVIYSFLYLYILS